MGRGRQEGEARAVLVLECLRALAVEPDAFDLMAGHRVLVARLCV